MREVALGLARRWLEAEFAPGRAEQILARLADELWEKAASRPASAPRGKLPSGDNLLDWARRRGVESLCVAGVRAQLMYIGPGERGFCLFVRLGARQQGSLERMLRRKLETSARHRWVFAHELGHTFFYDRRSSPPRKPYSANDPEEEQLCHRFASELLMPRKQVELLAQEGKIQALDAMLASARAFGIPTIVLARRLIRELEVLPATFALVDAPVAERWRRNPGCGRRGSASGIKVVSPGNSKFAIGPREVALSQVVQQVCISGAYSNTADCPSSSSTPGFVEATILKTLAPCGAIVCLFHESAPRFPRDSLFDRAENADVS
jgi:hypothetical protein